MAEGTSIASQRSKVSTSTVTTTTTAIMTTTTTTTSTPTTTTTTTTTTTRLEGSKAPLHLIFTERCLQLLVKRACRPGFRPQLHVQHLGEETKSPQMERQQGILYRCTQTVSGLCVCSRCHMPLRAWSYLSQCGNALVCASTPCVSTLFPALDEAGLGQRVEHVLLSRSTGVCRQLKRVQWQDRPRRWIVALPRWYCPYSAVTPDHRTWHQYT